MSDEPPQHGRLPHGNVTNITPLQTSIAATTADFPPAAYARNRQSPNIANFPAQGHPQQMEVGRLPGGHGQFMPNVGPRGSRPDPLDMGHMAGALEGDWRSPSGPFSQQIPQQVNPSAATPAMMYQLQQASQFAGGQAPGQSPHYGAQYPNFYQPQGYPQMVPSPQQHNPPAGQQPFLAQQFYPQPQQFVAPIGYQPPMGRGGQYQPQFLRRGSGTHGKGPLPDLQGGGGMHGASDPSTGGTYLQPGTGQAPSRQSSEASSTGPAIPRGPPRKPKQSGHALWVGNLPAGTNVIDLKEHFSKDATKDIESVFLISKSNCAFVNYRTEGACSAAMTRFHDSRFHGVKLVCRLRRGSTTTSATTPTAPSNPLSSGPETSSPTKDEKEDVDPEAETPAEAVEVAEMGKETEPEHKSRESFFVVKSLTVDDLESSMRNGIWATQAHNEAALNKAYETSENVYLIFSANKSGQYFGYARMASPINEDSASAIEWTPKTQTSVQEPNLPSTTPTPATDVAPKGRIIDDSARGTIFWEADPLESPEKSGDESKGEESAEESEDVSGHQSFGRPFKVEWITTERLPFYRTRGLRNPWNANREVKIARDGTQIEPGVGRRLIQMFHRLGSQQGGVGRGHVPPAPMQQMQMSMGMGFPNQQQQRHY